jgi:hypothetical protein
LGMTERLARHAALHPKRMLAIWGAIFVLSIGAIGGLLPSAITTDSHVTNDPESEQGYAAQSRHARPSDDFVNEVVVFRAPGKDVTKDPDVRRAVEKLARELEATGRTYRVATVYSTNDPSLVSRDRDATGLTVGMGNDA